jgi:hypothetical protein
MSFDTLAPHYAWIEAWFARDRLQRCRTAMVPRLPPPDRVLIYGEGNGRFMVEMLRQFPNARLTVVEMSPVMIRQARERLRHADLENADVRFIEADALQWQPEAQTYDLIVTCFFLDCFREDQLAHLVPVIARSATVDAWWLVADFQIARHGWQRLRSRIVVASLYRFFRLMTGISGSRLVDPAPLLAANGFSRAHHEEQDHGVLFCSLWMFTKNFPLAGPIPASRHVS